MTDRNQETQQELFGEFSREAKKPERFPGIQKSQKPILIHTNVEQLLLAGILAILALCFAFFLGVLRGKVLRQTPSITDAQTVSGLPAAARKVQASQMDAGAVREMTPVPARLRPQASAVQSAPVPDGSTPLSGGRSSGKPYTIQLATYKKRDIADKEADTLRRNRYDAFVTQSGDYFLVCVGQYLNINEAKKDLRFFASRYRDCFLRRR